MSLVAVKFIPGTVYDIYRVEENGRDELCEFLNELDKSNSAELSKLVRLFDRTATSGRINNHQKFKHLEDGIYEFKTPGKIRAACFFDVGKIIVVSHGFIKPKEYGGHIQRAINLRTRYLSAKNNECLTFREEIP